MLPVEAMRIIHGGSAKVVVFLNQKGGVAKTTSTANLAAFFAKRDKKVLVIDLDYQASATAMLLRAAGQLPTASAVDAIITNGAPEAIKQASDLGSALGHIHLLPAGASLNRTETRALFLWLLDSKPQADIRFNLLRFLASPAVQDMKFDLVLIDTPPRLTISTVNALAAATHMVVPTILDGLSIGNVGSLLGQVRTLFKQSLNPHIELAGIMPTMTDTRDLNPDEEQSIQLLRGLPPTTWSGPLYIFKAFVPDRTGVSRRAAQDLAILTDQGQNGSARFFEAVGAELAERLGIKL